VSPGERHDLEEVGALLQEVAEQVSSEALDAFVRRTEPTEAQLTCTVAALAAYREGDGT
jgi:hypothetical protein